MLLWVHVCFVVCSYWSSASCSIVPEVSQLISIHLVSVVGELKPESFSSYKASASLHHCQYHNVSV